MSNHLLLLMAPQTSQNPIMPFLFMGAIFAIFYFLILRPERKKQKDRQAMIAAIEKNDTIVTVGGVHGKVTSVEEESILVQVDTNVKLRIDRTAIASKK